MSRPASPVEDDLPLPELTKSSDPAPELPNPLSVEAMKTQPLQSGAMQYSPIKAHDGTKRNSRRFDGKKAEELVLSQHGVVAGGLCGLMPIFTCGLGGAWRRSQK